MNTLSLLSLVSLLPFVLGHGHLAKVEADGVTEIAPQVGQIWFAAVTRLTRHLAMGAIQIWPVEPSRLRFR